MLHDQVGFDLVVPGAEKYLYLGVADWCASLRLPCLGPTRAAAQLEKTKIFAKQVMIAAGIKTSPHVEIFKSDFENIEILKTSLQSFSSPVVKIAGPSLGKGVFVCSDRQEAEEILLSLFKNPQAGMEEGVLIEERLSGREVSVFFLCHDQEYTFIGSAQDYKRLLDGDQGPNTGGMGCFGPVDWVDRAMRTRIENEILTPTLSEMKRRGESFKGVLFLGLMIEGDDIQLLEYNVRFGDPETQVLMPLIEGDFALFLRDFLSQKKPSPITLRKICALHVVKAAKGYPGLFGQIIEVGQNISNSLEADSNLIPIYAGVKRVADRLVTAGGRILGLTALAGSLPEARTRAYDNLHRLSFSGEQYRLDIGAQK
jgi:phosphoribosylamine--glycine ligase